MSRTADVIVAVANSMVEDWHLTVQELTSRHGLTVWIVQLILTDDPGLVKKSACKVPKFLSPAQKQERIHHINKFLKLI